MALLTLCDEVRHSRIQEIGVYNHYDIEPVLRGVMGFGHATDYPAPITTGGGFLAYWGGECGNSGTVWVSTCTM